jgi:hypothetical protein
MTQPWLWPCYSRLNQRFPISLLICLAAHSFTALCKGKAVPFAVFLGITAGCYKNSLNTIAATKHPFPDASYTGWQGDALKTFAPAKCLILNAGQALRQYNVFKIKTVTKCPVTNGSRALGNDIGGVFPAKRIPYQTHILLGKQYAVDGFQRWIIRMYRNLPECYGALEGIRANLPDTGGIWTSCSS